MWHAIGRLNARRKTPLWRFFVFIDPIFFQLSPSCSLYAALFKISFFFQASILEIILKNK